MNVIKLLAASGLIVLASIASAQKGIALSVIPFENNAKDQEFSWLEEGIQDLLSTELSQYDSIRVIERKKLDAILSEQEIAYSGLADSRSLPKIGKLLSAKAVVAGSFAVSGGALRIDARCVDVESGEVIAATGVEDRVELAFAAQRRLAKALAAKLGAGDAAALSPEVPYLALKTYYTGLVFFRKGELAEAKQLFLEASRFDPLYLAPQRSLEEAYAFLKDFKALRAQRELLKLYEKAEELERRLSADTWMSYADALHIAYETGRPIEEFTSKWPSLLYADRPIVAAWHLQMTLLEIADTLEEQGGREGEIEAMRKRCLMVEAKARVAYAKDPFLPELIYQTLFAYQGLGEWERVVEKCEELMLSYPDYRMMWAVEGFYERALDRLSR